MRIWIGAAPPSATSWKVASCSPARNDVDLSSGGGWQRGVGDGRGTGSRSRTCGARGDEVGDAIGHVQCAEHRAGLGGPRVRPRRGVTNVLPDLELAEPWDVEAARNTNENPFFDELAELRSAGFQSLGRRKDTAELRHFGAEGAVIELDVLGSAKGFVDVLADHEEDIALVAPPVEVTRSVGVFVEIRGPVFFVTAGCSPVSGAVGSA